MFKYFKDFQYFLKYTILLVFLPSIFTGFYPGKITVMTTFCGWILFISYFNFKRKLFLNDFDGRNIIRIFLLYMAVLYIRGWGNIDSVTDVYAQLGTNLFFCFLFPSLIFISHPSYLYYVLKSFIWPGLLLCIICYFFPPSDGMMSLAHNASFLNVLILCIPFVKWKWRVLILSAVIFVVLLDIDRRSIMVNNVVTLLFVLSFSILKTKLFKRLTFCIFIIFPLVFAYLGFCGKFNIFEYMDQTSFFLNGDSRSLFVDSRTSIYEDVFGELKKDNAYIWGLGCNGKTSTSLTDLQYADYTKIYKYGRPSTESGMLNYIQYGGLLGFVLYGLLLIIAAYKATFLSKNNFMVSLGLFVAFKFLYSFIEDQVMFNAHTFYIFLWIGMCYNKSFREMTNEQIKEYFKLIFK